jgi:hypothetical protein
MQWNTLTCGAVVLAAAIALSSSPSQATTITYDIDLSVGSTGSVTGTITTDGALGLNFVPNSDFIAFDLLLNDGTTTATISSASTFGVSQGGLGLLLPPPFFGDSSGIGYNFASNIDLTLSTATASLSFCSSPTPSAPCNSAPNISLQIGSDPLLSTSEPREIVEIGTAAIATPAPASLILFWTGVGGLGLLGWRRKRRAQAAA